MAGAMSTAWMYWRRTPGVGMRWGQDTIIGSAVPPS